MEVTLESIAAKIDTVQANVTEKMAIVNEKLDEMSSSIGKIHVEIAGMNESIQFLVANSATHEEVAEAAEGVKKELRAELKNTEARIMDYVDRKDREYRGELNLSIQKEDKKVDKTVDLLGAKKVFAQPEIVEIKKAGPFQAPAGL